MKRNEVGLRYLWDNIMHNSHLMGAPERGENVFEDTMAENFPNLGKKTGKEVQEAQRSSQKDQPKEGLSDIHCIKK